ncbi:hypothetical protein N7470_009002 [Penicillium chermesinum]|nr:hypothetical protein N7470_009002 [Penicillium chermesinum]
MNDAAKEGLDEFYLSASADGHDLYEKFGFRDLEPFKVDLEKYGGGNRSPGLKLTAARCQGWAQQKSASPQFQPSADNPFQTLLTETGGDPVQLQSCYTRHRTNRNKQQKEKILSESFSGWAVDEILKRLEGPEKEEGYRDPRNCICIWARPPASVRKLIRDIQDELKAVAPSIWLMPTERLHITVSEVAHSMTEQQIADLVHTLTSSSTITLEQISKYPTSHQTRLLKPMVSFDSAALALSFVPEAGEKPYASGDNHYYSYHHLRRDVFDMVRQTGINVASRYVVPSAHVTIARFINQNGFLKAGSVDRERVKLFVETIEDINRKLEREYWPQENGSIKEGGEWVVGKEQGLLIQKGQIWYGRGEDLQ